MVRSIFEHCSMVWRPQNQTTITKLENIQRRAVKWICDEEYKSYSDIEYLIKCRQLFFLPLNYKLLFNDLILFHKVMHGYCPVKLPNYLKFFEGNRSLRSCHLDKLHLVSNIKPSVYAKYSKHATEGAECKILENSFFYRSHLSWNKLSFKIREAEVHSIFKEQLRKYLWDEALTIVLTNLAET